jgi:hypothetical protein
MNENVLHYERIAIRPDAKKPWQWYGPAIPFPVTGCFEQPMQYTAYMQIENLAKQACMEYELNFARHMQIVQASNEEAYMLINMSEL